MVHSSSQTVSSDERREEERKQQQSELQEDLFSIITKVFMARINRSCSTENRRRRLKSNGTSHNETEGSREKRKKKTDKTRENK